MDERPESGRGATAPVLGAVFLVLAGGLAPPRASAQSGYYAVPSVSFEQVYDDNLFSTSSNREDDYISRVTPALDLGYRSERLMLDGSVNFDAEKYAEHEELDSTFARREAALDLRYEQSRRLTVSAGASYVRSNNPDDVGLDTGLELGRERTERYEAGPAVEFRYGPRATGTADYTYTKDQQQGSGDIERHSASVGHEQRVSPRDTARLGYTLNHFVFESAEDVTSHVVDLGWSREMTPKTSVDLFGGPRFSDGEVDPEVSASLRHRLERGSLGLSYSRSQSTVIGEVDNTVETETFGADARYSLVRALEISAEPSFQTISSGGTDVDIYRMRFALSYEVNRYLSLIGAYRYSLQKGDFDGSNDEVERNVVWAGISLSYPEPRPSALPSGEWKPGRTPAGLSRSLH